MLECRINEKTHHPKPKDLAPTTGDHRIVIVASWCVVLMRRYLGIVWGPWYPREQVGLCFIVSQAEK